MLKRAILWNPLLLYAIHYWSCMKQLDMDMDEAFPLQIVVLYIKYNEPVTSTLCSEGKQVLSVKKTSV